VKIITENGQKKLNTKKYGKTAHVYGLEESILLKCPYHPKKAYESEYQ
jgi:hypothetical protein